MISARAEECPTIDQSKLQRMLRDLRRLSVPAPGLASAYNWTLEPGGPPSPDKQQGAEQVQGDPEQQYAESLTGTGNYKRPSVPGPPDGTLGRDPLGPFVGNPPPPSPWQSGDGLRGGLENLTNERLAQERDRVRANFGDLVADHVHLRVLLRPPRW